MLHATRPVNFSSRFDVVSCFMIYEDKFLLLHRQDGSKEPNTWGLPAGKREKNETPMQAIRREIEEETGLKILLPKMKQHHTLYVRYPEYDFTYYIFHTDLTKDPEITLNPKEHKAFTWVTPKNALKMKLIRDLDGCIKLFFKMA